MATTYSTECITKNLVFIKENIASVDRVLDLLLENDVIQMAQREDIIAKTPGERVHSMIEIVLKRRAQHIFIDSLKKTGQTLLADKIVATQQEMSGPNREPKSHTMSLLSPKIATYAPFHRERTSTWQQRDQFQLDTAYRRSHDEAYKRQVESLLETKRQNENKIRHLENEMEKIKKSEKKKYKQLEKEHKELMKENNYLKDKVDDLTSKLRLREKTMVNKAGVGEDEVDSPPKTENAFLDLKKSQENFENRLMKEMSRGQQQLLKVVEMQQKTIADVTSKLESATVKFEAFVDKMDNRNDTSENGKSTAKSVPSSDTLLPPLNQTNKLGKSISNTMARQESFIYDVGVPQKK